MLVYIPTIIISFICTWYATNFKEKYQISKKKFDLAMFFILVALIFIILSFVSGTRYGIGQDYFYTDNRVLNLLKEGYDIKFNEKIVTLIAKLIVVELKLPNYIYFIFFSIITNLSYIIAIFINKKNQYFIQMFIYLFYYIYFNSFSQTRSSAAIALGILGFSIIFNYRNNVAILFGYNFALIGALIHYSEIINVLIITLFILIRHFSNKIKNDVIFIIGLIVVALTPIIFIILKYTINYIPILKNYAYYFNPNYDSSGTPLIKFLTSLFSFIIPIITLIFYLLNFTKTEDYFLKIIGVILIINMIFLTIGLLTNSLLLSDRLKSTLYAFELFIIPYVYSKLPHNNQKYIYIYLIGVIMVVITLSSLVPSITYPYRSIFFKDIYIY